jgi:hypothetical protein
MALFLVNIYCYCTLFSLFMPLLWHRESLLIIHRVCRPLYFGATTSNVGRWWVTTTIFLGLRKRAVAMLFAFGRGLYGIISIMASKNLKKSSAIQNNSVTLSSVSLRELNNQEITHL